MIELVSKGRVQMSARYPSELVEGAHEYAIDRGLPLSVVLTAALAEYLAKRSQLDAGPAPQLHYQRGHPPKELVSKQRDLMQVDPRGRRLRRVGAVGPTSAMRLTQALNSDQILGRHKGVRALKLVA